MFSEDLQKAIQTSFPRAAHPYVAVTVLLLRWIDDDLNIQVELDRLRNVFDFQFNFTTEQWNIPSKNSTRALQAKLYDFQEAHQSESELLIVYYGGHGEASRRGKSIWAAYVKSFSNLDKLPAIESTQVDGDGLREHGLSFLRVLRLDTG